MRSSPQLQNRRGARLRHDAAADEQGRLGAARGAGWQSAPERWTRSPASGAQIWRSGSAAWAWKLRRENKGGKATQSRESGASSQSPGIEIFGRLCMESSISSSNGINILQHHVWPHSLADL